MTTGKKKIEKRKRRIPVPKKPPKVINNKKSYDRKKIKDEIVKKKNQE